MIYTREILMGRDSEYPLTPELQENLDRLLVAVNLVRRVWGRPMIVSSGYRPGHYNRVAGGSSRSAHLTLEAIDILDTRGELAQYLLNNLSLLEDSGLWMEDPRYTKTGPDGGWVHLQTRPTRNRVFIP